MPPEQVELAPRHDCGDPAPLYAHRAHSSLESSSYDPTTGQLSQAQDARAQAQLQQQSGPARQWVDPAELGSVDRRLVSASLDQSSRLAASAVGPFAQELAGRGWQLAPFMLSSVERQTYTLL